MLANTPAAQAIRHAGLRLTAVNVFAEGWRPVDGLTVDGPASVLVRRQRDGAVTVAVSDPTMDRARVSVVVPGVHRLVSADDGVVASRVPGGMLLRVDTGQSYGHTFTATLR